MISEIGEKIIELRKQKISLKQIQQRLKCSRATISTYCKLLENNDQIKEELILSRSKRSVDKEIIDAALRMRIINSEATTPGTIRNKLARKAKRAWLAIYAGNKCQACGYDKCLSALDYHHKDPTEKDFAISQFPKRRIVLILEELRKCVLLCGNCHSEVHDGLLDISHLSTIDISEEPPRDITHWYLRYLESISGRR